MRSRVLPVPLRPRLSTLLLGAKTWRWKRYGGRVALTPVEKDVNNGIRVLQYFASRQAWAGEKACLQALETGLRGSPKHRSCLIYVPLKTVPGFGPAPRDRASKKSWLISRRSHRRLENMRRVLGYYPQGVPRLMPNESVG